jgi:hypothetical protein
VQDRSTFFSHLIQFPTNKLYTLHHQIIILSLFFLNKNEIKYAKAMAEPFCKYFHFLLPLENQKGKKRKKETETDIVWTFLLFPSHTSDGHENCPDHQLFEGEITHSKSVTVSYSSS